MKKSTLLLGIASSTLALFGCLFKIMHWPGASVMLVLAISLFCFFFLPIALMGSYQAMKKMKTLHTVTFIVFFISMLGVLFKVMHWPGASIFLLFGLPLPFVLFLPVYLRQTSTAEKTVNDEEGVPVKKNSINFLGVMFGLTFLAVFSVLLALSPSKQVIEKATAAIEKKQLGTTFLNASKEESPVKKATDELCNYIFDISCQLTLEQAYCTGIPGINYEVRQIENKDLKDYPAYVMRGDRDENPGKIVGLKEKMSAFKNTLLNSEKITPELAELTEQLFDVSTKQAIDENGEKASISWEERELPTYRLIFVVDVLARIVSNAKLIESEYLASLK
jgi:hypothetical protein